ncbi:MAG: sensor histidine kinase [Dermatophilaceae bacterium]
MRWPGRDVEARLVVLLVGLGLLWAGLDATWVSEDRAETAPSAWMGAAAPWVLFVILALQVLPLLARRRHPYAAAAVSGSALLVAASFDYVPGIAALGPYVALHVAARTTPEPGSLVGRVLHSRWWRRFAIACVILLLAWFGLLRAPWVLLAVAVWWHGRALATRTAGVGPAPGVPTTTLQAVLDERARVARDLHDTVAHHVSVLAMQARIARRAVPAGTPEADHLLLAMETTSHLAMLDLRRALGMLAESEEDRPAWPRTLMVELGDLVDRLSGVGLPVTLTVRGTPQRLAVEVTAAAALIVQEALTNVLKHAGTVDTQLAVVWAADEVRARVLNEAPSRQGRAVSRTSGRGVHNMRRRAEGVGGTLTAGTESAGRFLVEAVLPVERHR